MSRDNDAPTLYGIGLGPGDPDLVTRRAEELVKGLPVLMAPFVGGRSRAAEVVLEINPDATVVGFNAPMTRDPEERDREYGKAAATAEDLLREFDEVGMVTLGDPTLYSTVWHVVTRMRTEFNLELVPGIPAFLCCSARAGVPLTLDVGSCAIRTRSPEDEDLDAFEAIALYKPDPEGVARLLDAGYRVFLCRNLGWEGEEVVELKTEEDLEKIRGYLCTVIGIREES